jgi:hypothetical protein
MDVAQQLQNSANRENEERFAGKIGRSIGKDA